MLAVTVKFRVKPGHTDDFRAGVLKHASNSLTNEPGCRQFEVGFDENDPQNVFLFEVYEDAAAFEAHRQMPYFEQFGTRIADWIESKELHTWALARSPG